MDNHSDIYQPIEGEELSENVEIPVEDQEEQLAEHVGIEGQPQENVEGEDEQLAENEGHIPGIVEADPEGQLLEAVGLNAIQVILTV